MITIALTVAVSGCATALHGLTNSNQITSVSDKQFFSRELSLARLSERHDQTERAQEIYQAILEKQPSNAMAHQRLGVIAAKAGDFQEAISRFKQAEQAGPLSAELLNDMGYAYYLQDDLDLAEKKLRDALAQDPQNQAARNNLGLVLGEKGDFEQSLAEFRRVNNEAEALANLAYVQAQMGELENAEMLYDNALTLNKTLRPAANALIQLAQRNTRSNRGSIARSYRGRPSGLLSQNQLTRSMRDSAPLVGSQDSSTSPGAPIVHLEDVVQQASSQNPEQRANRAAVIDVANYLVRPVAASRQSDTETDVTVVTAEESITTVPAIDAIAKRQDRLASRHSDTSGRDNENAKVQMPQRPAADSLRKSELFGNRTDSANFVRNRLFGRIESHRLRSTTESSPQMNDQQNDADTRHWATPVSVPVDRIETEPKHPKNALRTPIQPTISANRVDNGSTDEIDHLPRIMASVTQDTQPWQQPVWKPSFAR